MDRRGEEGEDGGGDGRGGGGLLRIVLFVRRGLQEVDRPRLHRVSGSVPSPLILSRSISLPSSEHSRKCTVEK